MPTPDGVPVDTMSPGRSGVIDEMNSTKSGILKISSRVLEFCSTSPLMDKPIASSCGLAISSRVTMAGPMGQKVGKLLPRDHCEGESCTSGALPLLTMVQRETCASKADAGIR